MERMTRLKAPPNVESVQWCGESWKVVSGYILLPLACEPALTIPMSAGGPGFTFPPNPVVVYVRAAAPTPERAVLHLQNKGRRG